MLYMCDVVFLQVWAACELSGHAAATKQEDHEEAEGSAQWPVQTPGQQRSSHHWCEYTGNDNAQ